MEIYVGNLSFSTTDEDLNRMFSQHGTVNRATVVKDRETGRSRGFGFVEMTDETAARAAIKAVNGKDLGGRALTVNEARPRAPRREGGGGGGGGGGDGYRSRRDW